VKAHAWGRSVRAAALACLVAALLPHPTVAQSEGPQPEAAASRGWMDFGLGGGWVHAGDAPASEGAALALDIGGGLWLHDRLGIGAHLGGWTLEPSNFWDPEEGESFSELFAVLALRPLARRPMRLTLEAGWLSYTVGSPSAVLPDGDGLGWRATVGWDLRLGGSWVVSPALAASWGGIDPDVDSLPSFDYWGAGMLLRAGWRW